jgi:methylated-DNA-protein-cysteine methyltransferase-like protein
VPSFADDVYSLVRTVPPGRVTTYGTISRLLGRPRSARIVGWALRNCPDDVPAHRVVMSDGHLSSGYASGHPEIQQAHLEDEGVVLTSEAQLDLDRYLWPDDDLDDTPPFQFEH